MNLPQYSDVSRFIESFQNKIQSNRNYNMLWKGVCQKIWESRINKRSCFCIYIDANLLELLDFEKINDNLKKIYDKIKISNYIEINNLGEVEKCENKSLGGKETKEYLSELSKTHFVFFFGEHGITRYINKCACDDSNIFYTTADRLRYLEKKDISQIEQVMKDYAAQCLTQQKDYMVFFADNATLRQINAEDRDFVKRYILKNRPEHYMRDHLRDYLSQHMKYTFNIEVELGQSKKELDIYFEVDGELYLIEIKWLGISINDSGTGISTTYTESRARDGVKQTLEYIEELTNTAEVSLRCGFLVIYDAREEKSHIDFGDYNFIDSRLKTYLQSFAVLPILPINKKHPA